MFEPEYVNIFGIPFMFLPHEDCDDARRIKPRKPVHRVYVKDNAKRYEITWPNVLRIDRIMGKRLVANIDKIPPFTLDAASVILSADMASVIDGKTHITDLTTIDMERINHTYRLQYMLLTAASQTIRRMPVEWTSSRSVTSLVGDIFAVADAFIHKGKITIEPPSFAASEVARAVVLTVNCPKIVEHIWNSLELQSTDSIAVMVNNTRSVCSTRDMPTWYTKLPVAIAQKSQINGCVCDSTWEDTEGYALDHNEHVTAWAKNDHLGFDVGYTFEGVRHRYRPDFLVKLDNGATLVLETKGEEDEKAKAKKDALKEWIAAVNADGRWGKWACDTSYNVKDVNGIINKIASL